MGAARVPFPVDAAFTDSDWAQDFAFFLDSWNAPDDFSACTAAELALLRRSSSPPEALRVTMADGSLRLPAINTWSIRRSAVQMAALAAGTWDAQLRLFWRGGRVETLLTFEMPIFAGLSTAPADTRDPLGPPLAMSGTLNVRRNCSGDIEVLRSGSGPMGPPGAISAPVRYQEPTNSPFAAIPSWQKLATITADVKSLIVADTSPRPADFDVYWTSVPAAGAAPANGVALGVPLGEINRFLEGIPVGDLYIRSINGAAVTILIGY